MRLGGIFCTVLGVVLVAFTLGRLVSFAFALASDAAPDAPASATVCPALAGLGLGMLLLLGGTLMLWKAKRATEASEGAPPK